MKNSKTLKVVIFIVVLLIPIIYSFFYLKSYWNPYGNLEGLKIAVVNLDEGENDESQGKEFVNELEKTGTFDICKVSLDEANEGMQNGDYYATITIPSNFTKCLNSASTTNKQISTITYSPNQASNYLATQIVNSAVKTMETNLQSKISAKIAGTLADKLKEVPDSLEKVSDASEQILDGSESLNSGLKEINDGTTKLNDSYTEFGNGVNSAYEGSKQLDGGIEAAKEGIDTLSEGSKTLDSSIDMINEGVNNLSSQGGEGINELGLGVSKINNGATKLNKGVNDYVDGTENLITKLNAYIDGVDGVNSKIEPILLALKAQKDVTTDPTIQALAINAEKILNSQEYNKVKASGTLIKNGETLLTDNSQELKDGAKELEQGANLLAEKTQDLTKITNGISDLKAGLQKVSKGTEKLKSGANALQIGASALSNGSKSLTNGLETLNNSSTQIKSALNTLNEGTNSAYNGSTELVNGVQEFKTQIDDSIKETNEQLESLNGIENFAEDPVEFKTEAYGEVNSYGIAFTPLFLCIGLWVGALMCYVVLYYDQSHRFGILDSTSKNKLLQNILYIAIGGLQGLIVGVLLKLGLGFDVQNGVLYYSASIFLGMVFISIIQFLIRNFGDIGKFLALIILVLQLAASGGTFPVETIDKAFQALTPYLPMTYSIKLLKEILVPTATNFKWQYIGILGGIIIITLGITYIVDIIKIKKQKEQKS